MVMIATRTGLSKDCGQTVALLGLVVHHVSALGRAMAIIDVEDFRPCVPSVVLYYIIY
jgi:hypothetical protein